MKTNTLKKILILIFTPLFFIKLSSCNDVNIILGDSVEFIALSADGNEIEIATHRIINNTVDFFIPDEMLNPDGQEFVDWVIKREGMAPESFDFNYVGNVRRVYAQFSAEETVTFNLSVRILDPAAQEEAQDIMEPLLNISTTVTSGEAPITIQEMLYSFDRDVEPMDFRNLSWYYMDDNNEADFARPVRDARFRFVELRQFQEENGGNGLSVVAVNHIIPREFVVMTGEGRIAQAVLPTGQDGNPVYDYYFVNRDGSVGSWRYTFIIPFGDLIIMRLNVGALASAGNIVSPGLEIGGFTLREYEIDESNRTTGRVIQEEGFSPYELNSEFTDRRMRDSRMVLEVTWRIRGARVTIHKIDSNGTILPGVINGLEEGQVFDVRTGQNPIRDQLMGLNEGAVDIINVMRDPRYEYQFLHWQIWVSDGQSAPTPTPFTISYDSDNPVPHGSFYVYLVGVWEPKEHELEIVGVGENPISILVPWNSSIESALEVHFGGNPVKEGYNFTGWYEYGTTNRITGSGRLMPALRPDDELRVQASWELRQSTLRIVSRAPNEMIDGELFGYHPIDNIGYFANVQSILDDFRENYEITRRGHTFGNWRIVIGAAGWDDLDYDMEMRGNNIDVFIFWTVNTYSVHLELYSDAEEYFAVIERDYERVNYGTLLWIPLQAIPIMREFPVQPLEWIITEHDNSGYIERRYYLDEFMEVTMPAYNIVIRLRLPIIEAGETPPPTSTIYIYCTEFGTSLDNLAIVGTYVSSGITNSVNTLNNARATHTVSVIRIINAENDEEIETVYFADMTEWTFQMPAHDIIVRIYWEVNEFQVTFDFTWLNARNIEVIGYNEPIFVAWGQPIAPALYGISMERFGYSFKYFTLAGNELTDDATMGTSMIALRSYWEEKILEIEVRLEQTGPLQGVSFVNIQTITFRQGLELAQLLEMLENNRVGNSNIIGFPLDTHKLSFELGYHVTRNGLLERLDNITFTSHHSRTMLTFQSDVDPRILDSKVGFTYDIFIEHEVTCLLSYLNERPFLGFFNQIINLFFGSLGYDHPVGGTFRGWTIIENMLASRLVENTPMLTSHMTLFAYWEVSGQIIIEGGNAMFFQEDNNGNPSATNTMTLTGIMPGANIIDALSSFINGINGLTGLPTVNHGPYIARIYNGHFVRVMPGRQIIGFAIEGNVNILHDPSRADWSIPAQDPVVTVRAIVLNYSTNINWQGTNVNSERPDGGTEPGFRITNTFRFENQNEAGELGIHDIIMPTFRNGRRVTEIVTNFIQNFVFTDNIFLPRYLTTANPLALERGNFGTLRMDLTNMPWLQTLPQNFARSGEAGSGTNRFYVTINPVSALSTINRASFQTHEWQSITMNLNLIDFPTPFNSSNISWWNQKNNFVWHGGVFNRTLNGVAGVPGW